MKAKALREQGVNELQQALKDLLREHFNLRMQQGTSQLSRPAQMRKVRRQIARVKTVVHEKIAGNAP